MKNIIYNDQDFSQNARLVYHVKNQHSIILIQQRINHMLILTVSEKPLKKPNTASWLEKG